MADSDLLENSSQLVTLKKVLAKEFGISEAILLEKVEFYEEKEANKVNKTLAIAQVTLDKLDAILAADGIPEPSDEDYSAWLDTAIETSYNEYQSNGRFEQTENASEETIS